MQIIYCIYKKTYLFEGVLYDTNFKQIAATHTMIIKMILFLSFLVHHTKTSLIS